MRSGKLSQKLSSNNVIPREVAEMVGHECGFTSCHKSSVFYFSKLIRCMRVGHEAEVSAIHDSGTDQSCNADKRDVLDGPSEYILPYLENTDETSELRQSLRAKGSLDTSGGPEVHENAEASPIRKRRSEFKVFVPSDWSAHNVQEIYRKYNPELL